MGRGATKASGNPWYEARIRASKISGVYLSREKAAELMDISPSSLEETENGKNKTMPVDKAVLISKFYGAPELLNYYCLHECPIGCKRALSDELVEIDRATVKLTQVLRKETVQWMKHGLQDIAMDGLVSDDEVDDLDEIIDELRNVSKIISELEIIRDKAKSKRSNNNKGGIE